MAGTLLLRRTVVAQRVHGSAVAAGCEIFSSLGGVYGKVSFHTSHGPRLGPQRPEPGCSTWYRSLKVTVLGASSATGKYLSLCLKQSPIIDELAIWDNCPSRGLMLDLSLMTTKCRTFYVEEDCATGKPALERALTNAKVVVIASDCKPLEVHACDIHTFVPAILTLCPKAFVAVVTNYTNSLIPMIFELYKRAGYYEYCNRLFGVMSLYSTRANGYAAEVLGVKPEFVRVPVIGGADARTVVPLFSHATPCAKFTVDEISRMNQAMKHAEDRVCAAYKSIHAENQASPICSGYSAARFCNSLCKAIRAETGVVECAYTRSNLLEDVKYLGAPLELGGCGVQRHLGVSKLTSSECRALTEVLPDIKAAIETGQCLALERKPQNDACQPA